MNNCKHFIVQFLAMSELYLRMTENNASHEISSIRNEEFNEAINNFAELYNTTEQT